MDLAKRPPFARRARPNRLGGRSPDFRMGSSLADWFGSAHEGFAPPNLPGSPQWQISGSLPGHSGATVPVLHRLPSWGSNGLPARSSPPPGATIRLGRIVCPPEPAWAEAGWQSEQDCAYTSAPVRTTIVALVFATAVTGCSRVPDATTLPTDPPSFSTHPFALPSSPAPLLQVQAGFVQAVVPGSWEAKPLPRDRYPQEGFVAAPRLEDWEHADGTVRGMEVFWIDVAKLRIPSDYYYLVARGPVLDALRANKACQPGEQQVYADHPPDLTGRRFSPSDYVAAGTGTCEVHGRHTRWAYLVAAPGYGPVRRVGLPTSGLYVVLAVVSGSRSDVLLQEMLQSARFGDTPMTQIVKAASSAPV